jgi:carboxyl-terminal processing protease
MGSTLRHSALLALGAVLGVAVTMQFSALAQKPVADGMPLDSLRQLADVYKLVKTSYVEPVEDRKLLTQAMSGMVDALDPHSAYLDQKAYRELREGTEGKFVGLGIEIGQGDDGYVKIVAPIEDSPAWRAGIKPGDLIARIDGAAVKEMALDDAIKRMRGEPHTKVVLTVLREGVQAPLDITIVRDEIVQKSVKGRIVMSNGAGYAWVRISQFQEPTVADLAAKLAALAREEPDLRGVVPDFAVDENADGDGLNALRMREADLRRHLSNDRDHEEATRKEDITAQMRILAAERHRKPPDFGSATDFQLGQALRQLQGLPVQLSKHAPKADGAATLAQQAH